MLDPRIRALGWGFTDVAGRDFSTASGKHHGLEALGFTPELKSQRVGITGRAVLLSLSREAELS